jgi:hypothetical protein
MRIPNLLREKHHPVSPAMAGSDQWLSPIASYIIAIALAASVFAIYSPALSFQFILDDHRFVGDPRVQSPGHLWEYLTSFVWAQVPGAPPCFYRPLFLLWMRLNFIFNGMSSWGWHLLSILTHVSVAILLGLLVWKLLRDRVAAFIAGTLFALHPAQTESVAWVTVPDPIMSVAILGTLLLYLRYAEKLTPTTPFQVEKLKRKSRRQAREPAGRPSRWIIASTAMCLAALMAKETAIVLPAVLLVMALVLPSTFPSNKVHPKEIERTALQLRFVSAFRHTLPYFSATAVYLLLRVNALNGQLSPLTQHLLWSTVLLSAPAALWFYVKVLLWPVKSHAFADPILAEGISLHGVLLPALGICCAAVLLIGGVVRTWRIAHRDLSNQETIGVKRALLLGTLLLVLPILLALNLNALNPGDFLHGRYTYLPLTGLMLLLATGWHLAKNWRVPLLVIAAIVGALFGVLTVGQESAWKDDLTVFTVAHENAPHNGPVALNLARANVQVALRLGDDGRCDEAMPVFERTIQQYPQDWYAWAGRGECLAKLNDLRGAEQSLQRAYELSREPRVAEEWQQVRAMLGLAPPVLQ